MERLLSAPSGGDLEIDSRLSAGAVDAVTFPRDPMTDQSNDLGINAMVRACDPV